MKSYIIVAGLFFYTITFVAIFWLTFLNYEESTPAKAMIVNVNTGDIVWQPNNEAHDKMYETAHAAYKDSSHVEDLATIKTPDEAAAYAAYAEYFTSLYTDDNEVTVPSVSRGSEAYTEAVCWHCHSQFVRPLASEHNRWGPTSQIGEGAHDNPTRYGTRRIGPDLAREGNARPDDWHLAHFVNPKYTVPQSIMAPYGGIARYWYKKDQAELDDATKAAEEAMVALSQDGDNFKKPAITDTFKGVAGLNNDDQEVWYLYKGLSREVPVVRAVMKPKHRIRDLIAYVQTRGTGIGITARTDKQMKSIDPASTEWQRYTRKLEFAAGRWRVQPPAPRPSGRPEYVLAPAELMHMQKAVQGDADTIADVVDSAEKRLYAATRNKYDMSIKEGFNLFMTKCAGCHGGLDEDGDPLEVKFGDKDGMMAVGNGFGPAAPWLNPEPRNLHMGAYDAANPARNGLAVDKDENTRSARERGSNSVIYKNRSGDDGSNLARPEDLFHTIRNGMPPSAMPAWKYLTDWQVWSLVNFVMYLGDGRQAILQLVDRYNWEDNAEGREQAIERIAGGERAFTVLKGEKLLDFYAERGILNNGGINTQVPSATYYNYKAVQQAFNNVIDVPEVPLRSSSLSDAKEKKAAEYWAGKLDGVSLDDGVWTREQLVEIGRRLFTNADNHSGGAGLDCQGCHGSAGDSWGTRRPELIHDAGFAARNYYSGQFKLGSTRGDIWRAMYFGIAGTLMTAQTKDVSDLESLAVAEFVLSKARQGVMGITDDKKKE